MTRTESESDGQEFEMKMNKRVTPVLIAVTASLLVSCAALRTENSLPVKHPADLDRGRPTCTQCHDEDKKTVSFKTFNHTLLWTEEHRFIAYQREKAVCSMCHDQSFCNDCHQTNRVELLPSVKGQSDVFRIFPHTGDYIARHRLDAEVDPTPCIRCHGNPKASKTCAGCHGSLNRRR